MEYRAPAEERSLAEAQSHIELDPEMPVELYEAVTVLRFILTAWGK